MNWIMNWIEMNYELNHDLEWIGIILIMNMTKLYVVTINILLLCCNSLSLFFLVSHWVFKGLMYLFKKLVRS